MSFKVGDLVECITPVGSLDKDIVYEVVAIDSPTSMGEILNDYNTRLLLQGQIDLYYAFRFKLATTDTAPPVSTAITWDTSSVRTIKGPVASISVDTDRNKRMAVVTQHNDVDSGLIATTGSKNDRDKVDLSLIPRISNIEHAKAFMVGEKKYNRYNYCKGHKASQLVAAAKRHLDAWFENEENDPVDGQHHLGSVMACCSMILRQQELGTLKDDRFKPETNI